MKKVIGIDLGTTNSVIGFKTKDVEIIRNKENEEMTRSCVSTKNNELIVGRTAFQLIKRQPENTILSVKRLIGRSFEDEMVQRMIAETKKVRGYYKFGITQQKGGTEDSIAIVLDGKQFLPEQISAEILKKLKRDAEEKLGDEISHAVITVPAYFTERQKNATKLAAKYAGIKILKLLAEPTAAAIAYGVDNLKQGEATTVLIYDFGGGTFDLSVLNIIDGQYLELGTGGDRWLGGDDLDKALSDYIYQKVSEKYNIVNIDALIENMKNETPKYKRHRFLGEMREAVENVKMQLSSNQSADIILSEPLEDEEGNWIEIELTITRTEFENLIKPFIQKTINLVDDLLKSMSYDITMIDNILLVGGSSNIPLVKEMLIAKFGNDKIKLHKKPMLAVAEGAAILAHRMDDEYEAEPEGAALPDLPTYSSNHNLYIMVKDKSGGLEPDKIIEKQMPLPCSSTRKYRTTSEDQKIIRIDIKSDAEEGKMEDNGIAFLTLDQNLPLGSEIIFEFELTIDELLKVIAYPSGQKNKAKQVNVTRSGRDAKAFETINRNINEFSSNNYNLHKRDRFMKVVIDKLKEAEEIGAENSEDNRWAKISYETQEIADKIVNEQEVDQTDYTVYAKILIGNYSMLIADRDISKMQHLIQIAEQSDVKLEKADAQYKLREIIDEYPVLFHVFFIRIAAGKAAEINPADAQRLHKMHETIIFHFQRNNSDEAFETLEKATVLMSKYVNPSDGGFGGVDITKF